MKLSTPPGFRPIGARALKSAIDSLRPWLPGAKVVDLFAGEGRFGVEALEEGAEHVSFVEKHSSVLKLLRPAVKRYGDRATVHAQDVFAFLEGNQEKFDILFADPPFEMWNEEFSRALIQLVARSSVSRAIFLVKHPTRVLPSLAFREFTQEKSTPFGESQLIYFRYAESAS